MKPITKTVAVTLTVDDVLQSCDKQELLEIVEAVCISADYQHDDYTKQKVTEIVAKYHTLTNN